MPGEDQAPGHPAAGIALLHVLDLQPPWPAGQFAHVAQRMECPARAQVTTGPLKRCAAEMGAGQQAAVVDRRRQFDLQVGP